jgi:hypothetical protein
MKLAIMQPYFFPYIGYFQLINAADLFVIYDDVNYIKQGWINRNYILANGKKQLVTLQLKGASSFKLINQIKVGENRDRLKKTIYQSYTKAPYFNKVFPVIERCLNSIDHNLATYVTKIVQNITDFLDIQTKLVLSSHIEKNTKLKGQERVLDICTSIKADEYINAIGGQELYSKNEFNNYNIKLYFIKTKDITYKQFNNEFIPNLSIIDMLMFNSPDEVKEMLKKYELII